MIYVKLFSIYFDLRAASFSSTDSVTWGRNQEVKVVGVTSEFHWIHERFVTSCNLFLLLLLVGNKKINFSFCSVSSEQLFAAALIWWSFTLQSLRQQSQFLSFPPTDSVTPCSPPAPKTTRSISWINGDIGSLIFRSHGQIFPKT